MRNDTWADRYIGLPFVEKGRDHDGVDCWGLVRLVYERERRIQLPSYLERYDGCLDRAGIPDIVSDETGEQGGWHAVSDPVPMDVVMLRVFGVPFHVGLYVEKNKMLHVQKGANAVLQRYDTSYWRHRFAGFWRYAAP